MAHFDYIIVGQGIAGTLLTYFLEEHGAKVLVIDNYNPTSSSNISSGIIHPITGRRKVKTWMADELIPFAEATYARIESKFGTSFYHKQNILELVDTTKDYNDWLMRSSDEGMKDYFSHEITEELYKNTIIASKKISLKNTGWLDLNKLAAMYREYLTKKNALLDESFIHENLKASGESIQYKDHKASKIIFCDGWLATQNLYWSWLPFLPAKGEILTIHAPDLKLTHILLKTAFVLPLGNNIYKVGSNYEWKELNDIPTQRIKEELINKLKNMITVPFEIIDHKAAVRPAIQDRRPVLGFHPEHKNIGIFNGLGTKGVLLAPWFADQLVKYMYNEAALNKEVDVKRFSR